MPRAGATYALPNTPVVTGTVISSNHYNTTLADIAEALSNSVSRDGSGTMTGPLRGADGSAAAPMFSFGADVNTGIYRAGPDQVGIAAGGLASAIFTSGQVLLPGGTVLLPSLSSQADPSTGITFTTSGYASLCAAGQEMLGVLNFGSVKIVYTGAGTQFRVQPGTAGLPSIGSVSDPTTGLNFPGSFVLGFSAGGATVGQARSDGLHNLVGGTNYRTLDVARSGISSLRFINDSDDTLTLADVNRLIYGNASTANRTITIPTNASVAFPVGAKIKFSLYNGGSGFDWRILAAGGVTLSWAAYQGTSANVVFGTGVGADVGYGDWIMGELHKTGTDSWFFTGMAQAGL